MAKKKEQITIREFISQNDIDELLESAFVEQAEAADELVLELSDLTETTTSDGDPDENDQRLASNDDIGALFKNADAKGTPEGPASNDDIGSIVSQSDIDALLSGGLDAAAPPTSAESELEDDIGGMISQGDIDALLKGAGGADEVPEPEAAGGDGMVSQSDIDALLRGAMAADEVPEPEAAGGDGTMSQSDLDALLSGVESASEDAGDSDLISQSDIEDLLGGGAKEARAVEETFVPQERNENGDVVSQSDIDALLKGALASEEEAGIRDDGDIDERVVSQSDIDNLLAASPGAQPLEDKEPAPEPVILAVDSEMAEAPMPATSVPPRPWHKKKSYRISAMAALVFIISSSVFLLMPRSRDVVPRPVVMTFPVPKPELQAVTARVQSDTNFSMPGFLVLAPADSSNITCLAADLLIDFTDTTTVGMIKENEGFVRNIIYSVINDALLSRDTSVVDKTKLALAVRAALGLVVPREMIRTVTFGKFEIF